MTDRATIDEIIQSPRQFCDLETLISLAETVRDYEAEIATLLAQVAAGDALLKVARDYFDNAERKITMLDSAMGCAIIAYEVAKGVAP